MSRLQSIIAATATHCSKAFWVWATLAVLGPAIVACAENRTWTSSAGRTIEAEFVELRGEDSVALRMPDGAVKSVKLNGLSDKDQDYVRKQKRSAMQSEPAPKPKQVSLTPSEIEAGTRALEKVKEQSKRCRTAEEAIVLYDILLGHDKLSPEVRTTAQQERAEWQRTAEEGRVRFGRKWVSQSEVRNAKIKAYAELAQGFELLRLNQDKLALDHLTESSKLDPESIQADFWIATIYAIVARRFDKAEQHYENCLKRDPNNLAVFNNLALTEVKQSKFPEAVTHFKQASQVRFDERLAQNMGRVIDQSGKRNLYVSPDSLEQLTRVYSSLVVSKRMVGANMFTGFMYMLIPREPLPEGNSTSSAAVNEAGQMVVSSSASGIVLNGGYVLTTRQLTRNATGYQIVVAADGADPKPLAATLVGVSEKTDAALLKCAGLSAPALPLAAALPTVESELVVAGCRSAISSDAATTLARVVGMPQNSLDSLMVYDAEEAFGMAGGPVCDKFGNLVAMHAKNLDVLARRCGAGVPLTSTTSLLGKRSASNDFVPGRLEMTSEELKKRAAQSTVTVLATARTEEVGLGKRIGDDYWEDCACCACRGFGKTDCSNRSCKRGKVPSSVMQNMGRNPVTGDTISHKVDTQVNCGVCGGLGVLPCRGCGGTGADPLLVSRRAVSNLKRLPKNEWAQEGLRSSMPTR